MPFSHHTASRGSESRRTRWRTAYARWALLLGASLVALTSSAAAQSGLDDLNTAIARLAEEVMPSVVQIESGGFVPATNAGANSAVSLQATTGTGVIVDADGLIVTNAHVVAGAAQVHVRLGAFDGRPGRSIVQPRGRRLPAVVLGVDRETDLALLRIDATGLPPLELADSEQTRQGQLVLAFGSPYGFDSSVTMGIISSVARQLQPDDRVIYIQTDAPINPGNSGGPLVDVNGRVMGINTMNVSPSGTSTGLGFAVPSNIVRSVVAQLREHGVFVRGEIGVDARTITPELAAGLELARTDGVVIQDVLPRGPASNAGLRIGDIVLSLNDKPMENARQFAVNLYTAASGEIVQLEILRGEATSTYFVRVAVRPGQPQSVARFVDRQQRLIPRLGILAIAIDDAVSDLLPVLRIPNGILVTNVALSAGAPQGLFLPGDVIHAVNGQSPGSVDELESALTRIRRGESVVLQIERAGRLSFVVAELF